jgi:PST family polysaccharide transporter
MRHKIKKFIKSDLFKISLLNGFANLIKILTSLISNKVTAVILGPAGIALLGQFSNFTSMAMSFATVGINNGITKFTAEYYDDSHKRNAMFSAGLLLTVVGTLIISTVVYFGRYYFSDTILHSREYVNIFTIISITLVLFALNALIFSILNGLKEFKKIVIINILTSILGLLIAIILIICYGVYGAFLGVILSQTLVFILTLFIISKSHWFKISNFIVKVNTKDVVNLLKFSLMTFTSIFAVIFIQLQIRNYIIQHVSIAAAGYWQGITKISEIYLMFITTTLSIYYLPKLSELKSKLDIKAEIMKGYVYILPLAVISSLLIFVFRSFIINKLFAETFQPMQSLFLFQIIGNILKIASWLLGYLMVAKAMTKTFIITEILSGIIFYIFTVYFVSHYGVVGATYSYSLSYLIYFIALAVIFRGYLV